MDRSRVQIKERPASRSERSNWSSEVDARQVIEAGSVERDHHSTGRPGRRSDDEVMGIMGTTGASHRDEEGRVGCRDVDVVVDDGERLEQVVEERSTSRPAPAGCQLDPDAELGNGDRSDRRFVVIGDQAIKIELATFGRDQNIGVQQQCSQNRPSTTN